MPHYTNLTTYSTTHSCLGQLRVKKYCEQRSEKLHIQQPLKDKSLHQPQSRDIKKPG